MNIEHKPPGTRLSRIDNTDALVERLQFQRDQILQLTAQRDALLAACKGLLAQLEDNFGKKTGLSYHEFEALKDSRIEQARKAISDCEKGGAQ